MVAANRVNKINRPSAQAVHPVVRNHLTRLPNLPQPAHGNNPSKVAAALNVPALRNPQAQTFAAAINRKLGR